MIYYTPEMFTIDSLSSVLEPLFYERETLEFKIGIFQDKLDSFIKLNYSDLMLYERKKKLNSALLPDLRVLSQLRVITQDDAVHEFKKILISLNTELSNVKNTITTEENRINNMFSFKDINLRKYLNKLNLYFQGLTTFENLMLDIFNNEFLNADIYKDVYGLRNYKLLTILIKKVPSEWRDIARIIYAEAKYLYTIEILRDSSEEEALLYIRNEEENRKNRYTVVEEKVAYIANNKSNIKKERSALNDSLFNKPKEVSFTFMLSRIDRHKEILNNITQSAIARGDYVTKVGEYIKNPANKLLGA